MGEKDRLLLTAGVQSYATTPCDGPLLLLLLLYAFWTGQKCSAIESPHTGSAFFAGLCCSDAMDGPHVAILVVMSRSHARLRPTWRLSHPRNDDACDHAYTERELTLSQSFVISVRPCRPGTVKKFAEKDTCTEYGDSQVLTCIWLTTWRLTTISFPIVPRRIIRMYAGLPNPPPTHSEGA